MNLTQFIYRLMAGRGKVADAVYAVNWWQVLLVDAAVGMTVVVAGLAVLVWWLDWLGVVLLVAGGWYVLMVCRRFLQWRWLRREAGM